MRKSLIITAVVIILGVLVFCICQYYGIFTKVSIIDEGQIIVDESNIPDLNDNMAEKIKILVVGVEENYLNAVKITDNKVEEELTVSFAKEGNIGFERGQEVIVYFNGAIASSWPGQITNPGKLEIVKQKSNIEIPKYVLKNFYSTKNNVDITIAEITNKGIVFTIEDRNDIKFDYGNTYTVDKQVRNENYTGIGYKIGEDTDHSTSAYSRNRSRILL